MLVGTTPSNIVIFFKYLSVALRYMDLVMIGQVSSWWRPVDVDIDDGPGDNLVAIDISRSRRRNFERMTAGARLGRENAITQLGA